MTRPSALGRPGSDVFDLGMWNAVQAVQSGGTPDTVTIVRPSGGYTVDPVTLAATPTLGQTIYNGPGRVQPAVAINERRHQVAGDVRTTGRYVAAVPAEVTGVVVDDLLTVDESHDPHLQGRTLVVRDVWFDTLSSRRVLICEDDPEVQS